MDKSLLQIFCSLSFIVLVCSAEHGGENFAHNRVYDLNGLLRKTAKSVQNSRHLGEASPLGDLQFSGIDEDFEFVPSGALLQNSAKCLGDILYTFQNIKSQWALRMIDSFGKPESSILQGNFKWVGDYTECIGVRATNPNSSTVGNFNGQYCSLTWSLSFLNLSMPLSFVTGVCIPDSCSPELLEEDALQLLRIAGTFPVLNNTKSTVNSDVLKCKARERHLTPAAKAMIAVLSLFFALVAIGSSITAVKYFKKVLDDSKTTAYAVDLPEGKHAVEEGTNITSKKGESDDKALLQDCEDTRTTRGWLQKLETFLLCFCLFTNGGKLLNTKSSEGELLCIHGVRFLSMSWVILGHSYIFGVAEIKNFLGIIPLVDNFPFQVMLQAFYSVDSFFVLSGFLLAFLSMKEFSKTKGSISWGYFYIHRYLRLTPIYMILLGFSATVYLYLGSGPFWPDGNVDEACKKVWWRNLLYINNFDLEAGQCFGWSWYLANDMQFFVISPLFLISLWRWPKIGYSLLAIFLCATCLSNFFITYHFDLVTGINAFIQSGTTLDYNQAMVKFAEYFDKLYVKPYTRIGPYLIGIIAGYFLFKRKSSGQPKHSLLFLTVGWIVATAVTLVCVYGLYHAHPSRLATSFYNAFNRTCFAMGLSWVIYVCLVGQGGVVNSILSFKFFIPLSRLTYSAYLIHPMIISGYFVSLKTTMEFSHPTMVILFLGFMVVTYGLALPVALALESPIVALEKLIRKAFMKEQRTGAVN